MFCKGALWVALAHVGLWALSAEAQRGTPPPHPPDLRPTCRLPGLMDVCSPAEGQWTVEMLPGFRNRGSGIGLAPASLPVWYGLSPDLAIGFNPFLLDQLGNLLGKGWQAGGILSLRQTLVSEGDFLIKASPYLGYSVRGDATGHTYLLAGAVNGAWLVKDYFYLDISLGGLQYKYENAKESSLDHQTASLNTGWLGLGGSFFLRQWLKIQGFCLLTPWTQLSQDSTAGSADVRFKGGTDTFLAWYQLHGDFLIAGRFQISAGAAQFTGSPGSTFPYLSFGWIL